MRGNDQHELMIQALKDAFEKKGFLTETQVHVRDGNFVGFVDLFIEDKTGAKLCVEVEQDIKRISNDYVKKELTAALLWIVVPTASIQETARRFIRLIELPENESFKILTYGQALSMVANLIPFSFQALREEK
ncbi:hypothetical protein Pan241w_26490 [Gimesia alba]|uniref:Restriction endonuclease type IV Mrr domain-containing protein n=1 Tax=Gimesia alba TaxID=2527973 RepID=A0A517RFA9_9PLAN|nr:hypothetical protein [Gimesia alba]QDT42564.1 hypothetical protein Pan241w_26490 [Gimesia alba]